jgi:hypothetical protein
VEFGHKALRLPAKAAGAATVRVVGQFAAEGPPERSSHWVKVSPGLRSAVGQSLKDLDVFPLPEENPDFYVDFHETGPWVSEVGVGECAGS